MIVGVKDVVFIDVLTWLHVKKPPEKEYKGISENTTRGTHAAVAALIADESIKKVLDIPCGRGAFTQRMMDAGKDVYSLDVVADSFEPDAPHFTKGD